MVNNVEIKRFLIDQNPHWLSGRIDLPPDLTSLYRPPFEKLRGHLEKRQILALIGARRVGKTVVLHQLMCHLGKDCSARNICWLSFDEEIVKRNPDVLDHLIKLALAEREGDGAHYVFIDEIQFVDNWQHILKRYYDSRPGMKFIVSGSSSIFLRKKTTESLVGRVIEIHAPPLAFWEYLTLAGRHPDAARVLSGFDTDWAGADCSREFASAIEEIIVRDASLSTDFDEYLSCRQFPEAVRWSVEDASDYIRSSVYKKTLLYDIPRLFEIRRPDDLVFLYNILMRESANLLEVGNLSRDAGINRNTVAAYLDYLKSALLHFQLSNATSSAREQRRLLRKGYVPSPNFTATLLKLTPAHPLWAKEAGHLAETFVAGALWNRHEDSVRFYRKGETEVDFVISSVPGRIEGSRLVEVKYSEVVERRDLKGLIALARRIGVGKAVCVTKNEFRIESVGNLKLVFLPIWALS